MCPLIHQLAVADVNSGMIFSGCAYFPAIKRIIPAQGFRINFPQIYANSGCRIGLLLESYQLGMVLITFGFPEQHMLRQKRLAPQGDEAFSIEIARMQ